VGGCSGLKLTLEAMVFFGKELGFLFQPLQGVAKQLGGEQVGIYLLLVTQCHSGLKLWKPTSQKNNVINNKSYIGIYIKTYNTYVFELSVKRFDKTL
jgi:hypothetical protein